MREGCCKTLTLRDICGTDPTIGSVARMAEREPVLLRSCDERGRTLVDDLGSRLRKAGYVRKWLILGIVIGAVAGLGAIVFTEALQLATRFFLVGLGGYQPPSPLGEGAAIGSAQFTRPWAIPLVVGLGGLISGVLVFGLAPEAEGHGTDAAIEAVHHNPKGIRGRVSLIKIIASAVTIGSGGSAGREGPTAQISAGFGSMLARQLDLTPADARIAVAVGIGSGIGAIFRAPLGGAVLGAEILYRSDFEVDALIPSVIASIIGFAIFGAVEGFTPIFGFLRGYHFDHPIQLGYFAIIGLLSGLIGLLYAKSFYGITHLSIRAPGSRMVKPAVAGVLVGLIGLAIPAVLGTGYGWVQQAMNSQLLGIPLWIVLALPFAKILATSLSIGSGGSGGIFGPGMMIGAFLGASVWRLLAPIAPGVPLSPAPFVVVGMMASFGAIAHAPIAVMLMVAEMTGSLELLAPAMLAVGVAVLVVGDNTIYTSQLKDRKESSASKLEVGMPLLASVPVTDGMRPPRVLLEVGDTVGESVRSLTSVNRPVAAVVEGEGIYRGAVTMEMLSGKDDEAGVGEFADRAWPVVPATATMDAAAEAIVESGAMWVPVLDDRQRVIGVLGLDDVLRAYQTALESNYRHFARVTTGATLIEEVVDESSPQLGSTLAAAGFPPSTLVLSIRRGDQLIFPQADTVLQIDDRATVLTDPSDVGSVQFAFRGRAAKVETPPDEPPPLI